MFNKIVNETEKLSNHKAYLKVVTAELILDFPWDPGYNFNRLNNFDFPILLSF